MRLRSCSAAIVTLVIAAWSSSCRPREADWYDPPPPPPPPPPPAPTSEPPTVIVPQPTPRDELVMAEPTAPRAEVAGCGSLPTATRADGDLVVPAAPAPAARPFFGRLRHHVDGPLSRGSRRTWVGVPVPTFVPLKSGTLELFLLDPIPGGYFALYRDPYGASSCTLGADKNCAFEVAAFDCSGRTRFRVPLAPHFSRKDRLEVQDARFADDLVYFNEACQSYSKEAKGQCSSLVALDPGTRKVLWRTAPLTSNSRFLVYPQYIVAGYGFTAEPDHLFVVRRSDGKVMDRQNLPSAAEELEELSGQSAVMVYISEAHAFAYRREGFDGPAPRLSLITELLRQGGR